MLSKLFVLLLVLLLVVPGNAVYLQDGDGTITTTTIGLDLLGSTVTNKFVDTAEVETLIGEASIEDLSDVGAMTPSNDDVLTWDTDHWTSAAAPTGGDMYKATYDTADDGTVDSARKLDADYVGDGLWYDEESLEINISPSGGLKFSDVDGALMFVFGDGLQADGDYSAEIKLNGTTLSVDDSGLKVNADGITNSELADNAVDTEQLADDAIGKAEIDWNTPSAAPSGNLVDATQIPLYDVGTYYTVDNAEAALQEVGSALSTLSGKVSVDDVERYIESFTTDGANYVCNLSETPYWIPMVFYGGSVLQVPTTDYTYNKVAKTVTLIGGVSGVKVVVSYEGSAP